MGCASGGAFTGSTFRERSLELHSGDVLLMYTDGLTEAMNADNEQFGLGRVEEHLGRLRGAPSAEICRGLLAAVRDFTGQARLKDDVTLITLKVL